MSKTYVSDRAFTIGIDADQTVSVSKGSEVVVDGYDVRINGQEKNIPKSKIQVAIDEDWLTPANQENTSYQPPSAKIEMSAPTPEGDETVADGRTEVADEERVVSQVEDHSELVDEAENSYRNENAPQPNPQRAQASEQPSQGQQGQQQGQPAPNQQPASQSQNQTPTKQQSGQRNQVQSAPSQQPANQQGGQQGGQQQTTNQTQSSTSTQQPSQPRQKTAQEGNAPNRQNMNVQGAQQQGGQVVAGGFQTSTKERTTLDGGTTQSIDREIKKTREAVTRTDKVPQKSQSDNPKQANNTNTQAPPSNQQAPNNQQSGQQHQAGNQAPARQQNPQQTNQQASQQSGQTGEQGASRDVQQRRRAEGIEFENEGIPDKAGAGVEVNDQTAQQIENRPQVGSDGDTVRQVSDTPAQPDAPNETTNLPQQANPQQPAQQPQSPQQPDNTGPNPEKYEYLREFRSGFPAYDFDQNWRSRVEQINSDTFIGKPEAIKAIYKAESDRVKSYIERDFPSIFEDAVAGEQEEGDAGMSVDE